MRVCPACGHTKRQHRGEEFRCRCDKCPWLPDAVDRWVITLTVVLLLAWCVVAFVIEVTRRVHP